MKRPPPSKVRVRKRVGHRPVLLQYPPKSHTREKRLVQTLHMSQPIRPTRPKREKLLLDFCHFGHSVTSPVLSQPKPRCSTPNYPFDRYQLPCIKLSLSAIPASSSFR